MCWAATRCAKCCCRWATARTWCNCWSRLTAESPVAKQIEKNGGRGGLAHVALRVADIQKAFDYLKENGFKIIDKAPRKGSRGTTVFFVHPEDHRDRRVRLPAGSGAGGQPCLTTRCRYRDPESGRRTFRRCPPPTWEAAIRQRSEGRRLREEAGLAHRGRARGAALLPPGSAGRPRGPAAHRRRASFRSCAAAASAWEIAQDAASRGPSAIRADLLHEAGAHAVQELGYAHRRRRRAAGGA